MEQKRWFPPKTHSRKPKLGHSCYDGRLLFLECDTLPSGTHLQGLPHCMGTSDLLALSGHLYTLVGKEHTQIKYYPPPKDKGDGEHGPHGALLKRKLSKRSEHSCFSGGAIVIDLPVKSPPLFLLAVQLRSEMMCSIVWRRDCNTVVTQHKRRGSCNNA